MATGEPSRLGSVVVQLDAVDARPGHMGSSVPPLAPLQPARQPEGPAKPAFEGSADLLNWDAKGPCTNNLVVVHSPKDGCRPVRV